MKIGKTCQLSAAAMLLAVSGAAHAHTGHGTHSLMEGLAHPLGWDHLLAMFAVGLWSVLVLPQGKVWQGPVMFLLALVLSATLGVMGLTLPYLEQGVSLSVVLFGCMLIATALPQVARVLPAAMGLSLIAMASSLHGLAHGLEAPDSGFATYAIGFLFTTALLHCGGVVVGSVIQRKWTSVSHWVVGGLGAVLSASGAYLFSQLAV